MTFCATRKRVLLSVGMVAAATAACLAPAFAAPHHSAAAKRPSDGKWHVRPYHHDLTAGSFKVTKGGKKVSHYTITLNRKSGSACTAGHYTASGTFKVIKTGVSTSPWGVADKKDPSYAATATWHRGGTKYTGQLGIAFLSSTKARNYVEIISASGDACQLTINDKK
jgi:hypothetical protein